MDKGSDDTARLTLDLLEARLRNIEYAIYGHLEGSTNSFEQKSASERLRSLENALDQLKTKSKVVQDLLKLRKSMAKGGGVHELTSND